MEPAVRAVTGQHRDLYWDDLSVGDAATSPGRTIGEADVLAFAGLSGDYNQLHMDAEFAAHQSSFSKRVAHGLLGLAVASGLFTRTWLGQGIQRHMVAMLSVEWRFVAPLFIGDTVHVEARVADLRATSKPGRGIAVIERALVNQAGDTLQEGSTPMLIAAASHTVAGGTEPAGM